MRVARRGGDRVPFLQQLLGDVELAAPELNRGGVVECERKDGQAAALTRDASRSARDRFAGVVFPEIQRKPAGDPPPGEVLTAESLGAKGRKGAGHRRPRRRVSAHQPRDDAF